jgi:molybdenum cofactor cytidylyltransferase
MNRRSSRVSGIVLAAGPSTRFAGDLPKQMADFRGEPLLRRVVRSTLASRLRQILVVVGHHGGELAAILSGLAVELVDNRAFAEGQSSSIRCALPHVELNARAAMFIPGDQPLLEPEVIDRLIDIYEKTRAPIVVPLAGSERSSPVLMDRSLFPELERIRGDAGGRQIFRHHEGDITEVPISDPSVLRDVDTRDDYEALLSLAAEREANRRR